MKVEHIQNVLINHTEILSEITITIIFSHYSGGVSHQLSATRLLSSPEGPRHPLEGFDRSWTWGADSFSSLHRDTYMEVRTPRPSVFTWGCFRACRAKIHHTLAKRKVGKT
ncbi:hypothetical protein Trydic_g5975 [Trypoxylus dichotomus]